MSLLMNRSSVMIIAWHCLLPCLAPAQSSLPTQWHYSPIDSVQSLSVSRDGQLLAVAGDGGVQVLRESTGQLLVSIPQEVGGFITSAAFSPDGSMLALGWFVHQSSGGYTGMVELRNSLTGSLTKQLPTTANFSVSAVAFSPDGRTLADGGSSNDQSTQRGAGVLELWSLKAGYKRMALNTPSESIRSIAFTKDGSKLVAGGYGTTAGSLELWDVKAAQLAETFPTAAASGVYSVAISSDGETIVDGGYLNGAAYYKGVLEEWSVPGKKLIASPSTAAAQVMSVSISPDGKTILSAGWGTTKGVIELWTVASGSMVTSLETNLGAVGAATFSANGKALFAGGINQPLEVWNMSSYVLSSTISIATYLQCMSTSYSPDGNVVVTGDYDRVGSVHIWNAQTGKIQASLQSASKSVRGVAVSRDNKTLASCGQSPSSQGVLELWNYTTGKLEATLPTIAKGLTTVQFSPDGKFLADGGFQLPGGVVELWDVSSKSLIQPFPTSASSIQSVAFSPDGKALAVGGAVQSQTTGEYTGVVEIWSLITGKLLETCATSVNEVMAVAFSPDSKRLAVGGMLEQAQFGPFTPMLEMWDVAKIALVNSSNLTKGAKYFYAIAFTRDGKYLYAGTDLDMEVLSASNLTNIATYNQGGARTLSFSARGDRLVWSSAFSTLSVSILR